MSDEGGSHPSAQGGDGRQAAGEKPHQNLEFRLEIMRAGHLPTQFWVHFRKGRNRNLTKKNRRRFLAEALCQLNIFKSNCEITHRSIDDRMDALGIEYVDMSNPLQVEAFAARLGTTVKALVKRSERNAAIEAAELEIQRILAELADGD